MFASWDTLLQSSSLYKTATHAQYISHQPVTAMVELLFFNVRMYRYSRSSKAASAYWWERKWVAGADWVADDLDWVTDLQTLNI